MRPKRAATVTAMSAPALPGRAVRMRRRREQQEARRRRLAVLIAIVTIAAVTLALTAFGGGGNHAARPALTPSSSAARLLPAGPPTPEVVASLGALRVELPVNQARLTAIGYYGGADGGLALTPVGTQKNAGILKRFLHAVIGGTTSKPDWYLLPGGQGPSTSALDVGAATGTDVYAPVDGTIVGITKVVLDGKHYGDRIDIQPTSAPSMVLSISRLKADPSLQVGTLVTAAASRIGEVIDFSQVEHQALAQYTNDTGNHVQIEVHPTTTLQVR
jgi:hypothetical protein